MEVSYPLLKNWIKKMSSGFYNIPTKKNMIGAGWFDWFCEIEDLLPRMKVFYEIFKDITLPSGMGNFRVSFKDCAPIEGDFYDYMYIENTKTDTQLIIEYREKKWTMYISIGGGDEVVKHFNSREDLSGFFETYNQKEVVAMYNSRREVKEEKINELSGETKELESKLQDYIAKKLEEQGQDIPEDKANLIRVQGMGGDTLEFLKYVAGLLNKEQSE